VSSSGGGDDDIIGMKSDILLGQPFCHQLDGTYSIFMGTSENERMVTGMTGVDTLTNQKYPLSPDGTIHIHRRMFPRLFVNVVLL